MSQVVSESFADRLTVNQKRTAAARAALAAGCVKRQHSAVTNGKRLFDGVDGRNPWVRRARDLIRGHTQDLGGPDNASAAERSIVRRAAVITTELEQLEARFALAGIANPDDLALYFQGANNLRRLLGSIGLRRRARDVTPTLAQYLDAVHQQQTDEEAAS
jgi:hypothetical protein